MLSVSEEFKQVVLLWAILYINQSSAKGRLLWLRSINVMHLSLQVFHQCIFQSTARQMIENKKHVFIHILFVPFFFFNLEPGSREGTGAEGTEGHTSTCCEREGKTGGG